MLHVGVPANPSIYDDQYFSLRNQLLNRLMQDVSSPVTCPGGENFCAEKVAQLIDESPVRYVVFTKGVPARALNLAGEASSVDGTLWDDMGQFFSPGRIDGMTVAAASALVDRALAAEQAGYSGNLLSVVKDNETSPGRFSVSEYEPIISSPPLLSESIPFGSYSKFPSGGTVSMHGWRYFLGVFDENDVLCSGNRSSGEFYLNYLQGDSLGRDEAPVGCRAKFVVGSGENPAYNELAPGHPSSRVPVADNVVAYLGNLDGQPSLHQDFSNVFNWKKSASCSATLCDEANDPQVCRQLSTDVYREIDTRCVGVADGFIGHNEQSYPLSYFTSWPTDWRPLTSATLAGTRVKDIGGGGNIPLAYPEIRTTDGDGDTVSVWFGAHDAIGSGQCFDSTGSQLLATCPDLNQIIIGQRLEKVAGVTVLSDLTSTRYYQVTLSYRSLAGSDIATANLRGMMSVYDPNVADATARHVPMRNPVNSNQTTVNFVQVQDETRNATLGVDSGGWVRVKAVFALDPNTVLSASTTDGSRDVGEMLLRLSSGGFSGYVGIDRVVIEEVDAPVGGSVVAALPVANADFQDGHRQFATGDWALTYTNRLNGVAFWGSSTHTWGGTGFSKKAGNTLARFLEGDSLGQALWGEPTGAGGLLYGDPLYSPVGIKINPYFPANYINQYDVVLQSTMVTFSGSTFNGAGLVGSTRYDLALCAADDFFECDRFGSWQTVVANAQGGFRDALFSQFDTTGLASGNYILRLSVYSSQLNQGAALNSYYQFSFLAPQADDDGDGLLNQDELTVYGSDPNSLKTAGYITPDALRFDSDNDGVGDGLENLYPCLAVDGVTLDVDSDGDGMLNYAEVTTYFGRLNPCENERAIDSDSDGQNDLLEVINGSDRDDPSSKSRLSNSIILDYLLD